jgi:putative membrane protein insertion efficiency factor
MKNLFLIPRRGAAAVIELYQRTLSPDHGLLAGMYPYGFCRFYPSCSEYGKIAIEKHGILKGGVQAIWRIMRCNPWTHPSVNEINN